MPQASNLTIADGQATPVNCVFAVEQATPALSIFVDRAAGVASGFRRIKVSNRFASTKSPINRSKFAIEYPVLQTVNGVSTVAYTLRFNCEFITPENATDIDRKNIYAFAKNSFNNLSIQSALRDLDPFY